MQPYPYAMQPMLNMPMGRAPFPQGAPPLYIGNLDDTVYEEQLFSHFSKYGPIHSLKIAKDPNSGRSRGFGYINFMQAKDAENARMLSQYEKIGKNPIRLMYKRNVRDTNESNVFVMNIDHTVSFKELHNLFAHVGNVLTVKINTNRKGESLGYGYVLMDKKEDALKAIETLNNHKLKEKEITTSIFVPKGQRNVSANKNLYVKGLPGDKSKEEIEALLREKFGKFGNILSLAAVFSDKDHRWFAFVCFENANEAEEAIKNIHETNAFLPEEPTYVAWHQSRFERDAELKKKHLHSKNDTNLFVKNLKPDVTDQTLRTAFSQFGEISSVAVNKREIKPEDTRAFGFVAFKHAQDALKAQSEGHRTEEIKQLFIEGQEPYINFWQPKGQRDQFKASKSRHPYGQRRGGPFGGGYMNNNMFPPMNMNYMRMGFPPMHMMNPNFQRQQRGGYGQPRHVAGARRGGAQGGRPHQGGAVGPYNGGARGGSNYRGNQGRSYGQNQSQYQARPNQDRSYTPGQQAAQPQAQAQSSSKDIKPRAPGTTLDVASNLTVAGLKDKLDDFLKLEPEKQRNILGELLYPKIVGKSGTSHAPKITGMLVDFDVLTVQDILEMLEDEQVLHERIQEAQELINQEGEQ